MKVDFGWVEVVIDIEESRDIFSGGSWIGIEGGVFFKIEEGFGNIGKKYYNRWRYNWKEKINKYSG